MLFFQNVSVSTTSNHPLQPTKRAYYWSGILMVFGAAFCFALKGIFIKLAYQEQVDTISILALRMVFALPVYVLIAFHLSRQPNAVAFDGRSLTLVAGLGILGYYVSSYLDFYSLNYISASMERVLLFVYPTFVLLINFLFRKKQITSLQLLALLLTYVGILITFVENIDSSQQKNLFLGAFFVVSSGFTFAFYLVGSDSVIPRFGSEKFTTFAMIAATVPTLLHCWVANGFDLFRFSPKVYFIGLTMAFVSTIIPTFMLAEGIKRVGSANASIAGSIGPIFTIVLATLFLGETISLLQIMGTMLVLLGVFLIGWKGKK